MTEAPLAINLPVTDLSQPGHAGGDTRTRATINLGGILGTGDLTTDDGDASGFDMWGVGTFDSSPAGPDRFQYVVPGAGLPGGAVVSAASLEVTARAVERTEGIVVLWDGTRMTVDEYLASTTLTPDDVQIYYDKGQAYVTTARAEFGGNLSGLGVAYLSTWDAFTYASKSTALRSTTTTAWNAGGTVMFAADTGVGDNAPRGNFHVTQARIVLTYTVDTSTPTTVLIPVRQVQRSGDGLGMSSAPRAIQRSSRQGTLRNISYL